ncbi:MAG TPA: hypothetical protein VMS64_11310 [Candidatus Methylomirabilis sp.]|nr:hypothetical protein [Candidatus Methylomirabilis sp.]
MGPLQPISEKLRGRFDRLLYTAALRHVRRQVEIPSPPPRQVGSDDPPPTPAQLGQAIEDAWEREYGDHQLEYRRDAYLQPTLKQLAERGVNLEAVCDTLERLKQEATLRALGHWSQQTMIALTTERERIRRHLRVWLERAMRLHRGFNPQEIEPHLGAPYEAALQALNTDPILTPSPVFPVDSQQRPGAGRPPTERAYGILALGAAHVPRAKAEQLLRAVGLIAIPPSDLR